jgi:hypothetical protein
MDEAGKLQLLARQESKAKVWLLLTAVEAPADW